LPSEVHARVSALLATWETSGLPGRSTLHDIADALLLWRSDNKIPGLWQQPPCMVGATLDDAWGLGIELILKYARVLGMKTRFLGTLLPWAQIVAACQDIRPDYLGLTVLQLDSEDDLALLRTRVPGDVQIIAGGPAFRFDDELQARVGIDHVAKDLAAFLQFFLQP